MRLRKLLDTDAAGMLEWMKDPEVNKNFRFPFAQMTPERVLKFIREARQDAGNRHYAVAGDDDGYLGTVSLKHIDTEAKSAEYAICICPKAQGTGAAAFATREILRIAFLQLGLNRVYLNVLSRNARAVRFYRKIGFIYEGEFKQHLAIRGEILDLQWFRMLKEEYLKSDLYRLRESN